MSTSRTFNSIRNTVFALGEQICYSVFSFICRTVFIYTLGKTYLGFSGLFSDILTLLSLAELGIGTAITYSMYKPTAEKDYKRVAAMLNEYKKLYMIIGISMTIAGLCLTPFLSFFVSDIPELPELPLIYILYLLNTTGSYFFIYKKSILITRQKNYVASLIYIAATTCQNILQIVCLLVFRNFILYLIIQLCATLGNNICISIYVNRKYPFIKTYKTERIDKTTKKQLFKNVRAMFASKLSSAVVTSTSNILISKFVSTIVLGLYSNYTMFTTMIRTIVSKIFEALVGSIGNLVVTESRERIYRTFRSIWFINFWLVSFCITTLYILVNPFIELWVGETFLLDGKIVFLICLNLYMRLMRNTFLSFQDTFGLFVELRWKCIAEAIINLVVSLYLLLGLDMGIYGILLGTFISNLVTSFWYEPYLLFVKKFGKSWLVYFVLFIKYIVVTVAVGGISYLVCHFIIPFNGWGGFILKLLTCCIVTNLLYFLLFFKTADFHFFLEKVKCLLPKDK